MARSVLLSSFFLSLSLQDIVIYKNSPAPTKISFLLSCYSPSGLKATKKDRLSANDIIQVKKIVEHIANKESKIDNAASQSNEEEQERRSLAEERLELICQDQVLDVNMDLRTIRHFIWKSSSELEIFYRKLGEV